MKYRKKPVVIEAEQLTPERALDCLINHKTIMGLSVQGSYNTNSHKLYDADVRIETKEGVMRARLNDWIIRGVKGELYPCKPDIFEKTYELEEQGL